MGMENFEVKRYEFVCIAEEYAEAALGSQPQGYGAGWWAGEWTRIFRGRMHFMLRRAGLTN